TAPETAPATQQAAPAPVQTVESLPPVSPPDQQAAPAAAKQTEQVLVLPDQQAAPAATKPVEPMPPAPIQESGPAPLPPPAPVSAKDPAIIPVHNEIAEEAEQAQPNQAQSQYTIKRTDFQPPIGLIEERRPSEDRTL